MSYSRKKFMSFFLVVTLCLLSGMVPDRNVVVNAKKKVPEKAVNAFDRKVDALGTKAKYKNGLYTATIALSDCSLLLVSDSVFGTDKKYATHADVYRYANGKLKFICKVTSTGTAYPLCVKNNTILAGFHHASMRYKISKSKVTLEALDGLYMENGKCTYTKYTIKNGKKKKVKKKKLSANSAEKKDYYLRNGNYAGKPIRFV